MATEWHYSFGGEQFGPVSAAELQELAANGCLSPNDLVWREGMSDWAPARKVRGLFPDVLPEPPPPTPKPENKATGERIVSTQITLSNTSQPVSYISGEPMSGLTILATNTKEARFALKELRLLKKQTAARKRDINLGQRAIRAQYTHEVRRRGSKFIGGGGVGRFIRVVQTGWRDQVRRDLAAALAPLEASKERIDAQLQAIERAIIQVESYLINQ